MNGPNADSFQRALDRFKRELSPSLINQFANCSLDDVRNVARDIQKEQEQGGKLRYLRRLGAFVEAMDQLGQTIEVFLNAHEFVCFIWGPIKFVLLAVKAHVESLDKILDVYARVSDEIPGLRRYQATFECHPTLARVLEDYYSDILSFHQAALSIFLRPTWKTMFHSIWKTFDSKLQPILTSMKSRRELLESEKASATLDVIHGLLHNISVIREKQAREIDQVSKQSHARRVSEFRDKLQAPDYQGDQEMSTHDRGDASGTWILDNHKFQSWYDNSLPGHSVLYVNGKPGAGKTTLMSAVVERLLDDRNPGISQHCVLYFYSKNQNHGKDTHNGLLRAILQQLVDQDQSMSDHLFEKVSSMEGVKLRSTKMLEQLVKDALETYQVSHIVLDGLDECTGDEAVRTVNWFLSLIHDWPHDTLARMRVLFSGQRDGVLDKLLVAQPSIELETSGHIEDIRQYCQNRCEEMRVKFDLDQGNTQAIAQRVMIEAEGMFLYARVVLENLLSQTSCFRLEQELKDGTFPSGTEKIDKAYERVAIRVFDQASKTEREDAIKILGWIVCARRLVHWREIQASFCIDPKTGDVDYNGKRLRVTCKQLCRSLVDIHPAGTKIGHPEDVIKVVHSTAQEFLIKREYIDRSLENAKIALFWTEYLTSEPFESEIDNDTIHSYAWRGYYALQDYAVQYCFDHLQECAASHEDLHPELFTRVMTSAEVFLSSYGFSFDTARPCETRDPDYIAQVLRGLPEENAERFGQVNLELRTSLIRMAIELLGDGFLTTNTPNILENLHGMTTTFKCPKPWCNSFAAGFQDRDDRRNHINRHELPFRCSFQHCWANRLGFDARLKLDQHRKNYHSKAQDEKEFPMIGRQKGVNIWTLATHGNLAAVKTLVDNGQDVNEPNPKGSSTPLYCAVKKGHFEICKYLLDNGADVNLDGNTDGHTPLHAAISSGETDIVHLLLNHQDCLPDKADSYSRTPFCYACALGQLVTVRLLLETRRINPDTRPTVNPETCVAPGRFMSPIAYACIEGHFAVVQYLLEEGQSRLLDEKVLVVAVESGRSQVVSFLLSIGLEVKSCRPVLKALRKSRTAMAKTILTYMHNKKSVFDEDDKSFKACVQYAQGRSWDEVLEALEKIQRHK